MLAIGMVGNALFPGRIGHSVKKRLGLADPATRNAAALGVIGSKGCDCSKVDDEGIGDGGSESGWAARWRYIRQAWL